MRLLLIILVLGLSVDLSAKPLPAGVDGKLSEADANRFRREKAIRRNRYRVGLKRGRRVTGARTTRGARTTSGARSRTVKRTTTRRTTRRKLAEEQKSNYQPTRKEVQEAQSVNRNQVKEERREFIQETRIKRRWKEPSMDRLPPPETMEDDEPPVIGYGEEDYALTRLDSRTFIPTRQRFIEEGTKLYPGGNVEDVLVATDFLEFTPLNNVHEPFAAWEAFTPRDFVPEEEIRWDINSGKFLYIAKEEAPFLFLTGVLEPGWELNWDDKWVPTLNRRFQIKVRLPLDPRVYYLKVFRPDREFKTYRFVQFWIKMPDALKIMIKENKKKTYTY